MLKTEVDTTFNETEQIEATDILLHFHIVLFLVLHKQDEKN